MWRQWRMPREVPVKRDFRSLGGKLPRNQTFRALGLFVLLARCTIRALKGRTNHHPSHDTEAVRGSGYFVGPLNVGDAPSPQL